MHVLMISDGDSKYGAPHSLKQMIKELKKRYKNEIRITVLLLSTAKDLETDLKKYGADVFCITYQPYYQAVPYDKWKLLFKYVINGIIYLFGRYISSREIEKNIDMSKVDIIHSNSSREDLGALLAERYRKPHIWHIREFGDKDYYCYSYRKDYIKLMNRSADKLIAVSDAVRKHWIKKGIIEDKIVTVYNGVEYREDNKLMDIGDELNEIRIIMMGSINETKGQIQLIKAIAKMELVLRNKVRVDIVGSGPKNYLKKIEKYILTERLEKVISLKGYITNSAKILGNYHIGIVCSRSEGFGRVTAEYMMGGLAVIASNTGANSELIRDGVDGLLYQYGEIEDLYNKIKFLCNYPAKIKEFGRNARNRAVGMFNTEINAKRIYQLYQEIALKNKEEVLY